MKSQRANLNRFCGIPSAYEYLSYLEAMRDTDTRLRLRSVLLPIEAVTCHGSVSDLLMIITIVLC